MAHQLDIPEGYDEATIQKWIGRNSQPIIDETGDGNYCMLVHDNRGNRRFLRFFLIDGTTQCSVDFDSSWSDESIFNILLDKFGQ